MKASIFYLRTLAAGFCSIAIALAQADTTPPSSVAPTTHATSSGSIQVPSGGSVLTVDSAKPELPNVAPVDPQTLARMRVISTIEEARPHIKKYDEEQESLIRERLASIQSMQGKSNEEKIRIKREIAVSQRERFEKQRMLKSKFELIERLELEKTTGKSSKASDLK